MHSKGMSNGVHLGASYFASYFEVVISRTTSRMRDR